MPIFPYGQREIQHLKQVDPNLAEVINQVGIIRREVISDIFTALISNVISQQISGKAAQTVLDRFSKLVGEITPDNILALEDDLIRGCGMSGRKAKYIKGIAKAAQDGLVDFSLLPSLSDSEVVKTLVVLRGVGVWTAEMLLIFSLMRPNVLSYHDLGIRRGMIQLHNLNELSKDDFEKYRQLYSPYGSTVSLYLWELAGQ